MNNLHQIAVSLASPSGCPIALFAATTVGFAAVARLLRGVTSWGAVAGGVVCFLLMLAAGWGGLAALSTVFLMTWAATRLGYRRKQQIGSAERRSGRSTLQVLANLGASALASLLYLSLHEPRLLIALSAALAEVAADTLSSEIGTVLGGTPRLVTTWEAVPAGTDGAVTWLGTLAGACSAFLVAWICAITRVIPVRELSLCAAAALAGTAADSLLGATLERKGIVGNNAVNFLSTAVAAVIAWVLA